MTPLITMPSVMSLMIELRWNGKRVGGGTGFVVQEQGKSFLITNWHCLAGRRSDTNEIISARGVTPDEVVITHNASEHLGAWVSRPEPILDAGGRPLWLDHPAWGPKADVVALELTNLDGVQLYPYPLDEPHDPPRITPSDGVIGFPFSQVSWGAMGIWVRGTVASEPELDYRGMPSFLVDSRTRPGQSGSPVVYYVNMSGSYMSRNGNLRVGTGELIYLLGVYSGRINDQSDLGIVWKTSLIRDVVRTGVRGPSL